VWGFFIQAVFDAPWYGYGWYQTKLAQYQNFENLKGIYTSTHNIFLDLILWNGFCVGFIILFLFLFLFYWLYKYIRDSSDYMIFLCLVIFLVHSMFEYPLFYPYFLLLFSFFWGYLLFKGNFEELKVSKLIIFSFIFLKVIGVYVVYTDYMNYQ